MANPHNWKENFIEQANKKLIYTICHGEFNPLLEYLPVTSASDQDESDTIKKLFDLKEKALKYLEDTIEERTADASVADLTYPELINTIVSYFGFEESDINSKINSPEDAKRYQTHYPSCKTGHSFVMETHTIESVEGAAASHTDGDSRGILNLHGTKIFNVVITGDLK